MKKNTREKIKKLHKKYSQGAFKDKFFELTWTHCDIVRQIALQLADNFIQSSKATEIDKELLEIGSLVHDIGVYQCFFRHIGLAENPRYLMHGVIGRDILLTEGFSEEIANFAAFHSGITADDIERQSLPLPKTDYVPTTLEEEIVAFADKFHSKHPSFITFEDAKMRLEKYGGLKVEMMEKAKEKFGLPDLKKIEKKYASWHREFNRLMDEFRDENSLD